MANIKSQMKRNRQNEKARERNKAVRSELRTRVKGAERAAAEGAENAEEMARLAVQRIDKAAQKGVLHKNTAARRKARSIVLIISAACSGVMASPASAAVEMRFIPLRTVER